MKDVPEFHSDILRCAPCRSGRSAQYTYPQKAATTFDEYKDYPQVRAETQSLAEDKSPSWLT